MLPWSHRMRRASIVLLLVARAAVAQPSPELTKEFQAGVDAFRLGKYDEARTHLEKARAIDPKLPGPYRFLAAVAKAQSRWPDCIENARKALELNPASVETNETRKLHDDCRVSAGRAPYRGELADSAAVAVTSNVPGATVKINGLTYGGTPMAPRPITAGKLEVDVEKLGWKAKHVEIVAPVGIVTDVDVELEADTTQQSNVEVKTVEKPTKGWVDVPMFSGSAGPTGTMKDAIAIDGHARTPDHDGRIELEPGTHEITMRRPGSDEWRRRVRVVAGQETKIEPQLVDTSERESRERVGFYVLAGGGALLAAGFGFALASEHAANDAREIQRVESTRPTTEPLATSGAIEPLHTRADFNAKVDTANKDAVISDIAYGAGLVAVGVGAYLLYRGAKDRTDAPPPFAIAPTRGGAFVAKEVRW